MKISQVGINLIKNYESLRLKAYKAVTTEIWYTIGYGHYGPDVKEGMVITEERAEEILVNDLARFVYYVNDPYHCPVTDQLNQNQFDALVSFAFNCGNGGLRSLCNGRTIDQIAEHIPDFNKSGGKVLTGLVRRRKTELDLFRKVVVPEMDKGVGKTIVNTWMKPAYAASTTQSEKDYIRWLANQVRLACGMKEDEEF